MEKWEIALNKFIKEWKNKKEVIGFLVCGSYVTGNPSKHSDIDFHIILSDNCKWRERGNKIIDGFLIEYFASPLKQTIRFQNQDYKIYRKHNAHMFATGKILFDKTGALKKFVERSKKQLNKKYPIKPKNLIEILKYHLWDMNDNLEEVYQSKGTDFSFVYYNFLQELFMSYSQYLRFDNIPTHKLRRFLTNEKDKKKYNIKEFPDKQFVKIFLDCIETTNKDLAMKKYNLLTKHTLKKMGGFNINGWSIRSPLDLK